MIADRHHYIFLALQSAQWDDPWEKLFVIFFVENPLLTYVVQLALSLKNRK